MTLPTLAKLCALWAAADVTPLQVALLCRIQSGGDGFGINTQAADAMRCQIATIGEALNRMTSRGLIFAHAKQHFTLESPARKLWIASLAAVGHQNARTADALRHAAETLRRHDLGARQFLTLMAAADGEAAQKKLAKLCHCSQAGISGQIDRLVARRLIDRERAWLNRAGDHGNCKRVLLTDAGRAFLNLLADALGQPPAPIAPQLTRQPMLAL